MKKQSDSKHITIDQGSLMKGLEWAYDQAVEGMPLFLASAEDLGNEYREAYTAGTDSLEACARRLVLWQVTKAGTSGFLSGLGGVLMLPVTIPANLASVLYVQTRMIAAIAHLGGHDLRSDQVRTLCYACMCGSATTGVLKDVGIKFGAKLTEEAIKRISGRTLTHINQKVGFRLVTKFGEKGLINLGKVIPLAGGIVGGVFDAASTSGIGKIARAMFIGTSAPDAPSRNVRQVSAIHPPRLFPADDDQLSRAASPTSVRREIPDQNPTVTRALSAPFRNGAGRQHQVATHADRIFFAAVALAGEAGQETFTRKMVRDRLGVDAHAWQSGYTAIFQGMRDDHPGKAPRVHDTAVGVFHRVKRGTYKLSTTGRRRAGVVGALHLQRADHGA